MSPQPSMTGQKATDAATSVTTLVKQRLATKFKGKKKAPDKSLFIFSDMNFIRRIVRTVIEYRWFEYIVILTILANCLSLALEVHLPHRDRTYLMTRMDAAEPIFLCIFTSEAVLKIMALGFILNEGAYMRSLWNIMDFIVVTTGLITINLSADTDVDLRFFRAIRVLRPLKLVKGIPSLQVVITSIIKAMAPLLKIGLLVLFLIMMFGIIGLELYRGIFNFTCWKIDNPSKRIAIPCSTQSNVSCPAGYACRPTWEGPYFGFVNFDNIGFSMLTVFQCITMEGWTDILYFTNKATDSQVNVLYYIPIIILGSFFMLNLILGVLSGEFAKERERVEKRQAYMKLREEQREQDMLDGYVIWVETAEEAAMIECRKGQQGRSNILKYRKEAQEHYDEWQMGHLYKEEIEDRKKRYTKICSCFCCGEQLKHCRLHVRHLIKTQFFYWSVIVLVLLNTVCVGLEHYDQPEYLDNFLFYAEYVFLSIFLTEILMKIFGLGFKIYFRSNFNRFDSLVVLMSTFEVVYQIFKANQSFGFSALRCIRLLRLLKLTRYWSSLRNLVLSLLSSVRSIMSLLLLLGLFIFILTLLGMQLFGGDFNFDEGVPSLNFDTFANALITVFVILTGENWNEVMYDGVRSQIKTKDGKDASMIYSAYFLLIVVFGNYTLLNVFLAIAVDNLANAAELSAAEQEEIEHTEKRREDIGNQEISKLQKAIEYTETEITLSGEMVTSENARTSRDDQNESIEVQKSMEEPIKLGKVMLPYSSLFVFGPKSFPRKFCHFVVNLRFFDLFIMMVIFASSVALAAEDPVIENSYRNKLLEYFDYAFTSVFLAEMILKVIDMGVILHPGAYMRDAWNIMDMFVVTIAVFSFLYRNLNTIKSLRVLRVLRPLKTINRVPQLKAVFETIIYSVKNVLNILSVFIIFQFIFAVVAVQLFKGKFFYCTDISKRTKEYCKGFFFFFTDEMTTQVKVRSWQRHNFHFDNLIHSMTTLFTVTTGEGWPTVLKNSMYSTFYNEGPVENYRQEMVIFYIVFFVVFPFFFVNIFVAFIIITFQEQGESEIIDRDLDKNQRKCIEFAINAQPISRFMPENKRSLCYKMWMLVMSTPFEYLIMTLIALNCIMLIIKSHTKVPDSQFTYSLPAMDDTVTQLNLCISLNYLNIAFTIIFSLECVLKLIAFKFKHYFKDPWNIFDFITVIGSISYVLLSEIKSQENPTNLPNLGFLRLFRAMRLLKILRRHSGIRTLLWTFIQSFKALPWVCLLIGLLFFIYCIIGMQVFGTIELNDETQINRQNNFRYFPMGLLLLFRCATGESWHMIMLDTTSGKRCECSRFSSTNVCLDAPDRVCGSNVSYLYFISFVLVTTFLMLNLFVAVIMDNFDYLTRDSSILGPHHLDEFIRIWAEYDLLGTGWIHVNDMYQMMKQLEPPVGFGLKCPARIAYTKLIRMNMPLNKDMNVNFNATLFSMIRESLQIKLGPSSKMDLMDEELRISMLSLWPQLSKKKQIDCFIPLNKARISLTVGKIYAAKLMVYKWNNFKKWIEENLRNASLNTDQKGMNRTEDFFDTMPDGLQYIPNGDRYQSEESDQNDNDQNRTMQLSDEMFTKFEEFLRQQQEEMENQPGPSTSTADTNSTPSSFFGIISNIIHKIGDIVVEKNNDLPH